MANERRFFTFTDDDLPEFVAYVERLRADGMTTSDIARRLSIGRTTLNDRLRKAKKTAQQ